MRAPARPRARPLCSYARMRAHAHARPPARTYRHVRACVHRNVHGHARRVVHVHSHMRGCAHRDLCCAVVQDISTTALPGAVCVRGCGDPRKLAEKGIGQGIGSAQESNCTGSRIGSRTAKGGGGTCQTPVPLQGPVRQVATLCTANAPVMINVRRCLLGPPAGMHWCAG